MTTNTTEKTDHTKTSEGLVSYLITLVQMTLIGVLILVGIGWFAFTIDLWIDPEDSVRESFKYLPYLIGLIVSVYLLGYLNNRLTTE